MSNRLTRGLERARYEQRLGLVGFLPAGFPSRSAFTDSARAAFIGGADALEVSVPGTPLPMDGPIIQDAGQVGAANITGLTDALTLATQSRTTGTEAVIALLYRETVDEFGPLHIIDECARADVDAILLPQLSFREQLALSSEIASRGLVQVLFLYLEEDLALLPDLPVDRPVIYVQSAGVRTGGRFDPAKARERVTETRTALGAKDAYVVVGFGMRDAEDVAAMRQSGADGVVIGTVMVEAASSGPEAVRALVDSVRPALTDDQTADTHVDA